MNFSIFTRSEIIQVLFNAYETWRMLQKSFIEQALSKTCKY